MWLFAHCVLLINSNTAAVRRKDQKAQNEAKKKRRQVFKNLKNDGDCEGLVAAARNTNRHKNREKTAVARGYDKTFDFVDYLADDNIHLLAAAATDASINPAESVINFVCKTAATKAMADLMIDYKKANKNIMKYSCSDDYDCDAPPRMSSLVIFENRAKTKTRSIYVHSDFSAGDKSKIEEIWRTEVDNRAVVSTIV